MAIGDRILWACRPGVHIPAWVVEITPCRIKIRVRKGDGSAFERWVDPNRVHKE
jgi:hypothetical protein